MRYSGEAQNEWLSELLSWMLPVLLVVLLWTFFFRRIGGAEGGIMSFSRSRAKIYSDDDVKVSFGDVAGVDEAAEELREIVEFLQHPGKYTAIGGRIPKGVLLVGPPGTGKTLLARAVAGEAKVPYFSLSGSEFVEMFVGVGAARVRDLFRQAEAKAPCIVFIDELDALGKMRMQSPMGGHEEREQTLNQLLAEMDGFDAKKGVIIMAATNRPEVLDPALLRPGRFDRQVLIDKPDVRGREAILRIHAKGVRLSDNVDLGGDCGADGRVRRRGSRQPRQRVGAPRRAPQQDGGRSVRLQRRDRSHRRRPRKEARHESARSAASSPFTKSATRLWRPCCRVSTRSTRCRSSAAASARSATRCNCRSEDRYLQNTRRLAARTGGAARRPHGREHRVQRDLDRRAERPAARHRHRPLDGHRVRHERRRRARQPRGPAAQHVPRHAVRPERGAYAEETARMIDAEVKRLIEDAQALARRVLTERRAQLDVVAERLLDKEVIEGDELRVMLDMAVEPPLAAARAGTHRRFSNSANPTRAGTESSRNICKPTVQG